MRRRDTSLAAITFGAVIAGASLAATAQQPAKVFRIGILSPAGSPSTKAFDALREGLRELGYIDAATSRSSIGSRPGITADCRGWRPIWFGCRSTSSSPIAG